MATAQMNPGELLETSGFYWKTCTLHAAVKLDVFTVIGDAHLTGEEICQKLNGAQRGVERLLDALTAMDLLEKIDGKYGNSPSSRSFITFSMLDLRAASSCKDERQKKFCTFCGDFPHRPHRTRTAKRWAPSWSIVACFRRPISTGCSAISRKEKALASS